MPIKTRLFNAAKPGLLAHQSGIAMIEFALALPLLCILFFGAVEITRFAIAHQKIDKIAFSMADLATQRNAVTRAELNQYAQAANQIMEPFGFAGSIIFSSVSSSTVSTPNCPVTPPATSTMCINWQHVATGGDASQIGAAGRTATPPGGYRVSPGQDIIVVEVYYSYTPLMRVSGGLLSVLSGGGAAAIGGNVVFYKTAVYKPRQGTLTVITP
jgi:Flp pilus assembly protein TadG